MKTNNPVKGSTYNLAEVFDLNLLDSPSLGFFYNGRQCVIQDSHVTVEEVLSVAGLAATEWRYVRTSSEWIPIFDAVDSDAVIACLDIEPVYDPYEESESFWATPKGFPRSQYYVPFSKGRVYRLYELLKDIDARPDVYLREGNSIQAICNVAEEGATLRGYEFVELVRIDGSVKAVFEVQQ